MVGPPLGITCFAGNILLDDSCAAVYWVEELTYFLNDFDKIPEYKRILDGAPKHVRVKYS